MVKIFSILVAFLENMNFNEVGIHGTLLPDKKQDARQDVARLPQRSSVRKYLGKHVTYKIRI